MKLLIFSLLATGALAAATAQTPAPGVAPAASPAASPGAASTPDATPSANLAAEPPQPAPTPALTEDEKTLLKLEQDWGEATMKGDVAFVDRAEAEEYVYTDPNGQMSNKHDSLEATKAGAAKLESFKIRDVKVRVYGDTAVLTGQTQLKGKGDDADVSGDFRWTDVFVKRDGRWQAVASQATAIQTNGDSSSITPSMARPAAEGQPAPALVRAVGPGPLMYTSEERELVRLEQAWAKACAAGDTAFADKVEAEEYVFTGFGGQKRNKAQDLAFIKSNRILFELRNIRVHIDGDGAVVSGEATQQEGDLSADMRWTDHFVRRDGRWQAVSGEATLIP